MKLASVVIDCDNAEKLSDFYKELLDWEKKVYDHGDNGLWITLRKKGESTTRLVFQQIEKYEKPIWPQKDKLQQQMMHLDFYSDNVEKDVENAIKCGATLANYQSGDWKVLIDPAGHPFCIVPTRQRRIN